MADPTNEEQLNRDHTAGTEAALAAEQNRLQEEAAAEAAYASASPVTEQPDSDSSSAPTSDTVSIDNSTVSLSPEPSGMGSMSGAGGPGDTPPPQIQPEESGGEGGFKGWLSGLNTSQRGAFNVLAGVGTGVGGTLAVVGAAALVGITAPVSLPAIAVVGIVGGGAAAYLNHAVGAENVGAWIEHKWYGLWGKADELDRERFATKHVSNLAQQLSAGDPPVIDMGGGIVMSEAEFTEYFEWIYNGFFTKTRSEVLATAQNREGAPPLQTVNIIVDLIDDRVEYERRSQPFYKPDEDQTDPQESKSAQVLLQNEMMFNYTMIMMQHGKDPETGMVSANAGPISAWQEWVIFGKDPQWIADHYFSDLPDDAALKAAQSYKAFKTLDYIQKKKWPFKNGPELQYEVLYAKLVSGEEDAYEYIYDYINRSTRLQQALMGVVVDFAEGILRSIWPAGAEMVFGPDAITQAFIDNALPADIQGMTASMLTEELGLNELGISDLIDLRQQLLDLQESGTLTPDQQAQLAALEEFWNTNQRILSPLGRQGVEGLEAPETPAIAPGAEIELSGSMTLNNFAAQFGVDFDSIGVWDQLKAQAAGIDLAQIQSLSITEVLAGDSDNALAAQKVLLMALGSGELSLADPQIMTALAKALGEDEEMLQAFLEFQRQNQDELQGLIPQNLQPENIQQWLADQQAQMNREQELNQNHPGNGVNADSIQVNGSQPLTPELRQVNGNTPDGSGLNGNPIASTPEQEAAIIRG